MKLTFLQLQSRDQSEFLNIPLMFEETCGVLQKY